MIVTIVTAIVVLGVLVFTHELGHFLVARACGIRVLTFSLGFGPKLVRIRRGETEYAISAIPFGGYVKMAGEVPGEEEEEGDIAPGTRFSDKGVGPRGAVVIAGPAMNYVLAVVIFIGFFWLVGVETIRTRVVGDVLPGSAAAAAGIQPGDEILAAGGRAVTDWEDLLLALAGRPAGPVDIAYRRDGVERVATVTLPAASGEGERLGADPRRPPVLGPVKRGGVAYRAGLRAGDRILSVDGKDIEDWGALVEMVRGALGRELQFRWERGGETLSAALIPEASKVEVSPGETREVGFIGISQHWDRVRVSFGEAVQRGWSHTGWWSSQVVGFLGRAVRLKITRDMVGGPLRIGELAGESVRWGWSSLLNFVAILSVHLALLNLLPIPILDGGQLFLLLPEIFLRRPLSIRQRTVLQQIGLGIVILLMVTVTALDVGRILGK